MTTKGSFFIAKKNVNNSNNSFEKYMQGIDGLNQADQWSSMQINQQRDQQRKRRPIGRYIEQ
jgi:hypothetical protein